MPVSWSEPRLRTRHADPLPRSSPQLEIGRTVAVGHVAHLPAPDQVNAMIDRFLAVSALVAV
jgi:hypothetical protein